MALIYLLNEKSGSNCQQTVYEHSTLTNDMILTAFLGRATSDTYYDSVKTGCKFRPHLFRIVDPQNDLLLPRSIFQFIARIMEYHC